MTIIRLCDRHGEGAYFCKDTKELFFERYGLDWERFKRHGMTAEELRGPGQHLDKIDALEAAAKARELREADHG